MASYPPLVPWWALAPKLPFVAGVEGPPGYHVETETNHGAIAAGLSVFAGAYTASLVAASTIIVGGDPSSSGYGPLFVPFAGPFICLGTGRETQFSRNGSGALAVLIDGLAQTTGMVLIIAGVSAKRKVFLRDEQARATPAVRFDGKRLSLRWVF